jgi:hypothetical protein
MSWVGCHYWSDWNRNRERVLTLSLTPNSCTSACHRAQWIDSTKHQHTHKLQHPFGCIFNNFEFVVCCTAAAGQPKIKILIVQISFDSTMHPRPPLTIATFYHHLPRAPPLYSSSSTTTATTTTSHLLPSSPSIEPCNLRSASEPLLVEANPQCLNEKFLLQS